MTDLGTGRQVRKDPSPSAVYAGGGGAGSYLRQGSPTPASPSCSAKVTGFCSKSGVLQPSGMSSTSCRMVTPCMEDFLSFPEEVGERHMGPAPPSWVALDTVER